MNGRVENDLKIFKSIEKQLSDFPDYIIDWYYYLKADEHQATTCRDYIRKIRCFLQFIDKDIKYVEISQMNASIVTRYIEKNKYKDDGTEFSDSYKQGIWNCLNNFFDFLESRDMIEKNIIKVAKIKRPKNRDLDRINQDRKMLSEEDFKKILNAVQNGAGSNKAKGYQVRFKNRDMAIMLLFMTTGMRKTALMEINVDDIDLNNHTLYIIDKGHKVHEYYLNDMVIESIKAWLLDRYEFIGDQSGALFVSKEKKRMHGNSIMQLVDKYAYEGLGYHISPHKLRSGLVSIMYTQTNGNLEFCRRMIGHSNIATTQRYIVTNNDERSKTAGIMNNLLKLN